MSGQERRDRRKKGPGGGGSNESLDNHNLDRLVPDIKGIVSDIDAALDQAGNEIAETERQKVKPDGGCVCF